MITNSLTLTCETNASWTLTLARYIHVDRDLLSSSLCNNQLALPIIRIIHGITYSLYNGKLIYQCVDPAGLVGEDEKLNLEVALNAANKRSHC